MSDPVAEAAAQLAEQAEQTQEVAEPGNAPAVAEASVTAPATAEGAGTATVGESVVGAMPATVEAPLADSGMPQSTELSTASGDLPNVASGAADPTTEPDSAPSADGANTTSPTDASSAEPPHVRIAAHLEAIYQIAKDIPHVMVVDTREVKNHVENVLHNISNGMAVSEGELVRKLEALYHML
jgi:hypothetical protein